MVRDAVDCLPDIDCSVIVRLAHRLLVEVREQGIWSCQNRLIHFLSCVAVRVGEYARAEQRVEVRLRLAIRVAGVPELFEEVLPTPEKIELDDLELPRKELQAVLEHQVLAPVQRQILLHSLADEVAVEEME